jgi:rod shape determining protein RodA
MVLGRLPTIGVPLPFLSYGGSALLAAMCGVALMLNVRARRFVN